MPKPFVHPAAASWRATVESGEDWAAEPNANNNPGEAGGFAVVGADSGLQGYLKPTKKGDDTVPRAANEKIVADLAFDLQLPAPPVVLYKRDPCPATEEARACVSLFVYPEYYPWSQLMALTGAPAVAVSAVLSVSSGVVALDTLVGNIDRNNGGNAVIGIDKGNQTQAGFMFIDHAYSLNCMSRWEKDGWKTISIPDFPALLCESIDREVVLDAVGRVEALSDSAIDEVVKRIPIDYMTDAHKSAVIAGLKGRRSMVRAVVCNAFGL